MLKNWGKVDLHFVATELREVITNKITVTELTNIIKRTENFKREPEFATGHIEGIIEDRKTKSETIK